METEWRGSKRTLNTWFWKDDLHIKQQLYFGILIAPDAPAFVSRAFLPFLIAAQGDIDARTLFEKGLLSPNDLDVYEDVERMEPTATKMLHIRSDGPQPRELWLSLVPLRKCLSEQILRGFTSERLRCA
jgi:hypothetical protein